MMLRAKGKNQNLIIAFYKFFSWLMTKMLFLFIWMITNNPKKC